jgi:hypothetical protein
MRVSRIGARLDQVLHYLWLGLRAAVLLGVAAELIARVTVRLRARRFEIGEGRESEALRGRIAGELGIPEVGPSQTRSFRTLDDLRQPLMLLHEGSNSLQALYHMRVARCIACLGLALTVLGLSLTVLHGDPAFEEFAAIAEVIALGLALVHWWTARMANHLWIAARTKVELLRQWTFLRAFLPPAGDHARAYQAQRLFDAKAAEIDAALSNSPPAGWWQWIASLLRPRPDPEQLTETLEEQVRRYWDKTRAGHAAPPAPGTVAPADLHLYLRRRPVRQLAWFQIARKRLRRSGRLREDVMARLFLVCIVLAIGKVALVVWHHLASAGAAASHGVMVTTIPTVISIIAMALLAATTISAALTSIYLSRNDRSLRHRYAAQERRIEGWLRRVWQRPGAGAAQLPTTEVFTTEVLNFEELMLEELIDWVHISAHDALELGP